MNAWLSLSKLAFGSGPSAWLNSLCDVVIIRQSNEGLLTMTRAVPQNFKYGNLHQQAQQCVEQRIDS